MQQELHSGLFFFFRLEKVNEFVDVAMRKLWGLWNWIDRKKYKLRRPLVVGIFFYRISCVLSCCVRSIRRIGYRDYKQLDASQFTGCQEDVVKERHIKCSSGPIILKFSAPWLILKQWFEQSGHLL